MDNSPPTTQQLSRRRQSRRADRRLSQSLTAATMRVDNDDNDDNETPGETTRLMNNSNFSNGPVARQRRQSKLSASISSFSNQVITPYSKRKRKVVIKKNKIMTPPLQMICTILH